MEASSITRHRALTLNHRIAQAALKFTALMWRDEHNADIRLIFIVANYIIIRQNFGDIDI